jgi:uncharacterized protein (UPF0371 family)
MKGFDNDLYVKLQSERILNRIDSFGDKLYLEFGGKLFDDLHAARVLPGFDCNTKVKILQKMKDKAEVIFCISAQDIVRNKIRADHGITYGMEVLRVIDLLRDWDIYVSNIVITQFEDQPAAEMFRQRLLRRGENVWIHRLTKGYPMDVDTIVSDEGYGANPYIPTKRPLVVVTAPGPGSGKLATCLSQLYHESKMGNKVGYAKYETFPIWNLDLKHPVNVAYEAATADLQDINVIDHFHLDAYGVTTVNYNRDVQSFPLVKSILEKILGREVYKSPTDMGVNMVAEAIYNDEACREAARQEVIRRYLTACVDYKKGTVPIDTVHRLEFLMKELGLFLSERACLVAALEREKTASVPVVGIELEDGRVVTGKQSALLTASSAAILNALKVLAGMDDKLKLLPPQVIEPILELNRNLYHSKSIMMTLEQTLVALTVSQAYNDAAVIALSKLPLLRGAQAHSSHIPSHVDNSIFRMLGVDLTSEAKFVSDDLYTD